MVTEDIFLVPGIGQALILALATRDFNIIQAIVLVVGVFTVTLNLVVDILYGLINPRVRYA